MPKQTPSRQLWLPMDLEMVELRLVASLVGGAVGRLFRAMAGR